MIVVTTPTVEGHFITEYLGAVTGAATYLAGGFIGEGMISRNQASQFSFAWEEAARYMRQNCPDADAIVGVQHDLCSVANGNMVLTLSGTAVKLSKDPTYELRIREARQQEAEMRARLEAEEQRRREAEQEEERRRAEEQQRELARRQEEMARWQQELDERIERTVSSLEGNTFVSQVSEEDRRELIDTLSYAVNMSFVSKARARLKQARVQTGQGVIEYLLSLPYEELKPVAAAVLEQLKAHE